MNAKPLPLAAALLLCAAVTQAQPFAAPSGSSTNNLLQLGGSNSFSLAPSSVADDMIFKCSTVPYRPCTTEETNKRELILETGRCPSPITTACTDFLMTRAGAGATQLLGNQANPATANDDFYKKCGTVPYRPCSPAEEKQREAWLKSQSKPDVAAPPPGAVCDANSCTLPPAGAIQGPPQMVDMPKGFDGKMLQYPDGRVEYCFDSSCTKTNGTPLAPDQARSYLWNDYADQKQMANSINGGGANRKAAVPQTPPEDVAVNTPVNPGGGTTKSSGPGFSAFSTPAGGNNPDGGSTASDDAGAVVNAQDQMNGGGSRSVKGAGGGGTSVASSGGSGTGGSGSGGSTAGGDGGGKMVKVKAASLDGTYTYQALMPAVETTIRAGEAIKAGQTEFVAPDGTNVHTKGGELKVDETKLGKIQASHQ